MTDHAATLNLTPDVQVLPMAHGTFGVLRLGFQCGAEVLSRLGAALGLTLPQAPNTAQGAQPRALWTAPREWTLIDAGPARIEAVEAACRDVLCHYAELGASRVGFRVTGADAARLIASECPLDLDALGPDRCAQSVFAGMPILVDRRQGEDGYRLYVDASLANHLRSWLAAVTEGLCG
jgi:heterotetrameric sarcosine oxidase gamma subunit